MNCFDRVAVIVLAGTVTAGVAPADDTPVRTFDMQETAITASRLPRTVLDEPQSTSVVDSDDIRMRQSRTTPEALQEETGILVQETNLGGGSPFLRGQVGNRILLLIDGIRLNNSTYRFGPNQYLNTVDAFGIDRIEIVRGPASVLYGSDALGGAVNVIPKRRENFGSPFAADASFLTRIGSAAFEKTLRAEAQGNRGGLGFYGGATARDFDDLRAGSPTGTQDNTGYHEVDGDARLQYRIRDGHDVAFLFQRVDQLEVPNTVAFEFDDERFFFDPQERTLFALEHAIANPFPGLERLRSTVSYHDQKEIRERQKVGSALHRTEEDQVGTIGATMQADVPLFSRHLVVAGFEYYRDDVDSSSESFDSASATRSPGAGSFPDGSTYDSVAGYGQATIELLPPLALVGGARYSHFSLDSDVGGSFGSVEQDFDDVTGALSVVWRVVDPLRLVATWAQGFRAPNLDDTVVLRAVPEQNGVDAPNPDLDPETVDNWEVGMKVAWPRFAGSLFYYFSEYENLIERAAGTFEGLAFLDTNGDGVQDPDEPNVFTKQNVGEAEVQGLELDFEIAVLDRIDLFGAFSWVRGQNTTADEPFRRIPPMLGRAGLRWLSADARLRLEYVSRVASEQDRLASGDRSDRRIPPGGTPGWQTQNVRGGWNVNDRLTLTAALENFTDEQYRIHGSGIDAPGINFLVTAEVRF